MHLPVMPPLAPMLARAVPEIPEGMAYEPKWDGFRSIVFRDGDEVEIGSRNERPMTRYFPEVVAAVRDQLPSRCVVDGEIVIARGNELDFEALLQRIHPARSRVDLLARQTPASFVAFDLLALDDTSYLTHPFRERRAVLEKVLAGTRPPVSVTPVTGDLATAREWFRVFEGAGLDGVVAKPLDLSYLSDQRAMYKVKHLRTADCVVAGFRWHKSGPVVGSLLLGLYDQADQDGASLQHVGVAASFAAARRRELLDEIAPYRMDDLHGHPWAAWAAGPAEDRMPGGAASRWNRNKDMSWQPLRPDLVVEVSYDHMEGARFRHTAQFLRWRTDRDPRSCTYAQLERPVAFDLAEVLGAGRV